MKTAQFVNEQLAKSETVKHHKEKFKFQSTNFGDQFGKPWYGTSHKDISV